ncbi:hypothetical protein ABT026_26765 [Streptomyces sp. NPDC002734]|uniref:lipase/acyltransferase domain-containing protein n=1 Tax=Streptomyces sp. NPDC002734 TaxID=3154426 RepID=UPI003319AC84
MNHDLVVLVPGIMGTALLRDGVDVWDLTPEALGRLTGPGQLRQLLQLPEGIGDDDPDPRHALEIGGLVHGRRLLPGLISSVEDAGLGRRLGVDPARFAVFRYDWRLSNRNSARQLERFVETRLSHWRETTDPQRYPGARDAKVVFLCRSMGGLVVRYYAEVLEGWKQTRAVATLGTPFSGSVKALRFLTGRMKWVPAPLAEQIRAICATYPSVAQMLPTYRVVLDAVKGRVRLGSQPVDGIDRWMLDDCFRLLHQVGVAVRNNDKARPGRYELVVFGGDKHRTDQAVSLSVDGRPRFHQDLSASSAPADRTVRLSGDGTVSNIAQMPPERISTVSALWLDGRHADLINVKEARRQLRRVCDGEPVAGALSEGHPLDVEIPDFAEAGAPIEVCVANADTAMNLRVRLIGEDGVCVAEEPMLPYGGGDFRAQLRAGAGRWTVEVRSEALQYSCRDVVLVA